MKLSEASVLITGSGSGIGCHLLKSFLPKVHAITTFDINKKACASLRKEYSSANVIECDVADSESLRNAYIEVDKQPKFPNVLINNAGWIHSEPLVNLLNSSDPSHSIKNWNKAISVNLDSVFYVTREFATRHVRARTKAIVINISSISASGNAGQTAYSAAKAGVNALTSTWAKELGPLGMRFVSIAPGFIDTPSTREALGENAIKQIKKSIPQQRLGKLSELQLSVEHAIENDYLNGIVLQLNGGLVI